MKELICEHLNVLLDGFPHAQVLLILTVTIIYLKYQ